METQTSFCSQFSLSSCIATFPLLSVTWYQTPNEFFIMLFYPWANNGCYKSHKYDSRERKREGESIISRKSWSSVVHWLYITLDIKTWVHWSVVSGFVFSSPRCPRFPIHIHTKYTPLSLHLLYSLHVSHTFSTPPPHPLSVLFPLHPNCGAPRSPL